MLKITLNLKENTKFFSLGDLKRRASGLSVPDFLGLDGGERVATKAVKINR